MKTDLKKKGLKTFSLFCFEAKPIQVLSAVSLKHDYKYPFKIHENTNLSPPKKVLKLYTLYIPPYAFVNLHMNPYWNCTNITNSGITQVWLNANEEGKKKKKKV